MIYLKVLEVLVKILVVFLSILYLIKIFFAYFDDLLNYALIFTFCYLVFSFSYFSFTNSKNREKLINMNKIYFSSMIIVLTILFSVDNMINEKKIEYQNFLLENKNNYDINQTIVIKKMYETYLLQFQTPKTIENDIINNNYRECTKESTDCIYVYQNFFITLCIIINLFMIQWFLVEFIFFKEKLL